MNNKLTFAAKFNSTVVILAGLLLADYFISSCNTTYADEGMLVILLSVIAGIWYGTMHLLIRPLQELAQFAAKLSQGDTHSIVSVSDIQEIAAITASMLLSNKKIEKCNQLL